jgi:SecD/SecF fusion protein
MNLSIEFTWGMNLVLKSKNLDKTKLDWDIKKIFIDNWVKDTPEVRFWDKDWNIDVLIKVKVDDDKNVNNISQSIRKMLIDNKYIENDNDILSNSIIWPSMGDYMKKTAIQAVIIWLIFISIYILFAFSWVREFIAPWSLAIITVFTMLFDITVWSLSYSTLMMFNHSVQVDVIFIIAILTIMGYSINDTIIIFDRVRENFHLHEKKVKDWKITYEEIFETSLWQTMKRSLWTSTTTLLVLIVMYFVWTWILKMFAFTLWSW